MAILGENRPRTRIFFLSESLVDVSSTCGSNWLKKEKKEMKKKNRSQSINYCYYYYYYYYYFIFFVIHFFFFFVKFFARGLSHLKHCANKTPLSVSNLSFPVFFFLPAHLCRHCVRWILSKPKGERRYPERERKKRRYRGDIEEVFSVVWVLQACVSRGRNKNLYWETPPIRLLSFLSTWYIFVFW